MSSSEQTEKLVGGAEQQSQELRVHTPYQLHVLTRLDELARRRKALAESSQVPKAQLKLLDRGLYSLWLDALDQGLEKEAQLIIRGQTISP